MRTTTLLVVAAVMTTALLTYTFTREEATSGQPQSLIPQNADSHHTDAQDALDKLADDLEHYQTITQAQLQRAQQEQTRLNTALAALTARLGSVENAVSKSRANADPVRGVAEPSMDTANELVDHAGKPVSRKASEADLGRWVDETLRVGNSDAHLTAQATEQAAASLGKLPNINLEDMQCNQRICRATFANAQGKEEDIQNLFGAPPFMNEGFTLYEADGRVMLYFTQPGVSLAELREEVQGY